MSATKAIKKSRYSSRSIKSLFNDINHGSLVAQFNAITNIRNMLADTDRDLNTDSRQIINANMIPKLLNFAQKASRPALQYESLWILSNIASGLQQHTKCIIQHNGHKIIIDSLANSDHYQIKDNAVWALGNIAGEGKELATLLIENGILDHIMRICQSKYNPQYAVNLDHKETRSATTPYEDLLNTTAWTLSNLAVSNAVPNKCMKQFTECLWKLLQKSHRALMAKSLNVAVQYLIDHGHGHIIGEWMGDFERIDVLMELVRLDQNQYIRAFCWRIFDELMDTHYEYLMKEHGLLNKYGGKLCEILDLKIIGPQAEAKMICYNLSNIAQSSKANAWSCIRNVKLFNAVIDILRISSNYNLQREAFYVISNTINQGDSRIIHEIIKNYFEVIVAMCKFMESREAESDFEIQKEALICIMYLIINGDKWRKMLWSSFIAHGGHDIIYMIKHYNKLKDVYEVSRNVWEYSCLSIYSWRGLCLKPGQPNLNYSKINKCKYCKKRKKEAKKLYLCTKCFKVKYCSKHCQKRHWSMHKGRCRLLS